MSEQITTAGIDVSKATLDMAMHGQAGTTHVKNTSTGWDLLAAKLAAERIERVGLEATGGYERGIAAYLRDRGVTVVLLQPAQVRAFGKMHLRRAKADRIDAVLIAACTASAHHWNEALMQLLARLRARGMSHTCAIVACARKLLTQVNAVVARGTPWENRSATAA